MEEFTSPYETDFRFVKVLGRGGFGRVFEVENRLDGFRYAIKRIKIDEAMDDRTKFLREVKGQCCVCAYEAYCRIGIYDRKFHCKSAAQIDPSCADRYQCGKSVAIYFFAFSAFQN